MTPPRTLVLSLLAAGLVSTLIGCDSKSQQGGAGGKSRTSRNVDTGDDEEDDEDGSDAEGGGGGGGDVKDENVIAAQDVDFASWCKMAGETAPVKDQLKELFAHLCKDGAPTKLLTETLLARAYEGKGNPNLYDLEEVSSDSAAKTTSYTFGVAIKLPTTIKTHFDKVGPKTGDPDAQKKLAEASGAKATITIEQTLKEQGKYHVRGWLIHSKATKDLLITKVVTESKNRPDQFLLKEGEFYLYTQYVQEAISTVKSFDMLSAGIKAGKESYLIAVSSATIDNLGFSSAAEDEIVNTALSSIKRMYASAAEAKD